MEQFYRQPGSLFRTVGTIRGLAFVDLFTSVAYLFTVLIWPNKGQTFSLITLFQILHFFSWAAAFASSSGMYAHEYILMTGMVYIVALMADVASLIWRAIIINTQDSFQIGILTFNSVMVLNDLVLIIVLGTLLTKAKEFKDSINVALRQTVSTELLISQYTKIDYRLYSARNYVRIVAMMDLFLTIVLAVMFALGLSINQTFAQLTLFQLPHTYLWIAGLGIEKGTLDWGFIIFFSIHCVIAVLLDLSSLFWRVILMADCTNCSVFGIFGWIMTGIGAGMTAVSFAQIFLSIKVYMMTVVEFHRLLLLVSSKLHPYSARFYSQTR